MNFATATRSVLRIRAGLRFAVCSPAPVQSFANNGNVAVYPERRLIYNRIKKSGNSSMVIFLDRIFHGTTEGGEDLIEAKKTAIARTITPLDLPFREIRRLRRYYKFTVFRNPYTRCLSMFLDKVAPARHEIYSMAAGFGNDSRQGFTEFVEFLHRGGVRADPHFLPQTSLLFFKPQAYDLIGTIERLEPAIRRVCLECGVTVPPDLDVSRPHPLERGTPDRLHFSQHRLGDYFDSGTFRKVHDLYRIDFEVGGYDPEPPL